ncbi:nicotinate-nucleotide adenylyltransferase [bacterium]|nr:nicotinate-nucleotide adenylyltransferase [candidate division CSSED10-310 bacterium]
MGWCRRPGAGTVRLGLCGGTFNPIHVAHLVLADEARRQMRLDKVLFIPSNVPPHKHPRPLVDAAARLAMVRLAIAGNKAFELSDLEIRREGHSYTLHTLRDLRRLHASEPDLDLHFITGLDSFLEIETWYSYEDILASTCFIIATRPGAMPSRLGALPCMAGRFEPGPELDGGQWASPLELVPPEPGRTNGIHLIRIPAMAVSSTEIRRRIGRGEAWRYLVPPPVHEYIETRDLYREPAGA